MLREPADVQLAHSRVVNDLRATQRHEPGPGQRGEGDASVRRIGFPANETLFLEPDNHARNPARREHALSAEFAHAQSQTRGGGPGGPFRPAPYGAAHLGRTANT